MAVYISTGSCFNLGLNRIESIEFVGNYQVNGLELMLAYPQELLDFKLNKNDKATAILKRFEWVSIHMPSMNVTYDNNQETKKLLAKGIELGKQINAKNLVFHPHTIKDFNILKNSSIQMSIENMDKNKNAYKTLAEIKNTLEKYPYLGFVLDINHVLGNNLNPSDFLEIKDRITEIHVSGLWMKKGILKEHGLLAEGTKEQLEKVKPILELNKPKIIESDFYPEKIPLIEKEIQLIKDIENAKK
jgi:endonuclease IV